MKISFFAFALSLAVAQANNEAQHVRKLQQTSFPNDPINFHGAGCVDYDPTDSGWMVQSPCDDCTTTVNLGFAFDAWDLSTTSMVISSNGFIGTYIPLSLSGFQPGVANERVIAPLFGDNVPSGAGGVVRYKQLPGDRFAVIYDAVREWGGAYSERNTYQVVISGASSNAPQVCFCYEELSWAQGWRTEIGVRRMPSDPPIVIADFADGPNFQATAGIMPAGSTIADLEHKSMCFNLDDLPTVTSFDEIETTRTEVGAGNDPHFKTWKGEHFEYHGQCDLVLAKDEEFAEGLGLDIQIRTKLVRYWSYIKTAVIRIGNDILEIEGSSMEGVDKELHYWSNYEYQGELTEFAGFPVNIKSDGTKLHKNVFEIDLSSKYPGQKIIIKTFKEFVKVDFVNPTEKSFGKTVGMLGDFKTGKTLARDGETVLDDFTDLGREWQVLPSDKKLFREASEPQFPAMCIEPEDPRGERRRRLESSAISEEEAEAACAGLKDELDRKDCVYDILATQDLDMAGAF